MIGRLTGKLVAENADGTVFLDACGVGYEVSVPAGAIGRARSASSDAELLTLHVHTHVREDIFILFGFATQADRQVFRLLLGVSKVGPRTALGILSCFSATDLAQAVQSGDVGSLTRVPGIGKKLAEMIVLQLRDKTDQLFLADGAKPSSHETLRSKGAIAEQVVAALSRMGFKPSEVERVLGSLGDRVQAETVETVIREALVLLRP